MGRGAGWGESLRRGGERRLTVTRAISFIAVLLSLSYVDGVLERPSRSVHKVDRGRRSASVPSMARSQGISSGQRQRSVNRDPWKGAITFVLQGPNGGEVIKKLLRSNLLHKKASVAGFLVACVDSDEVGVQGHCISSLDGSRIREFSKGQGTDLRVLESAALPEFDSPADVLVIGGISRSVMLSTQVVKRLRERIEAEAGGGVIVIGDELGCIRDIHGIMEGGDIVLVDARCSNQGEVGHIARALSLDIASTLAARHRVAGAKSRSSSTKRVGPYEAATRRVGPYEAGAGRHSDMPIHSVNLSEASASPLQNNKSTSPDDRFNNIGGLEMRRDDQVAWGDKARRRDEKRTRDLREKAALKLRMQQHDRMIGLKPVREDWAADTGSSCAPSDWSGVSEVQRQEFAGDDQSLDSTIDYPQSF